MRQWKMWVLGAVLAGGLVLAGAAEALAGPGVQQQTSGKSCQNGGKKIDGGNGLRRVGNNGNGVNLRRVNNNGGGVNLRRVGNNNRGNGACLRPAGNNTNRGNGNLLRIR
jgi:hypothetical protein